MRRPALLDQPGRPFSPRPFLCTWENIPSRPLPNTEVKPQALAAAAARFKLQTPPEPPSPGPEPPPRPRPLPHTALTLTPTHPGRPAPTAPAPLPRARGSSDPRKPDRFFPPLLPTRHFNAFATPALPHLRRGSRSRNPPHLSARGLPDRTRSLPQGVSVRARSGVGRRKGRVCAGRGLEVPGAWRSGRGRRCRGGARKANSL